MGVETVGGAGGEAWATGVEVGLLVPREPRNKNPIRTSRKATPAAPPPISQGNKFPACCGRAGAGEDTAALLAAGRGGGALLATTFHLDRLATAVSAGWPEAAGMSMGF